MAPSTAAPVAQRRAKCGVEGVSESLAEVRCARERPAVRGRSIFESPSFPIQRRVLDRKLGEQASKYQFCSVLPDITEVYVGQVVVFVSWRARFRSDVADQTGSGTGDNSASGCA